MVVGICCIGTIELLQAVGASRTVAVLNTAIGSGALYIVKGQVEVWNRCPEAKSTVRLGRRANR